MDRFFIAWIICIVCTALTFEIICVISPFLNSYYYLLAKNVFCLIVGHLFYLFTRGSFFKKQVHSNKKAVFITGCDSGFGFRLAKRLDSKGYHVFAGCLFPTSGGATELKSSCSSKFCALQIDVTQDDSVQNAKEFVEENLGDCELWAVVNNAGVFKGLDVEHTPISDFVDNLQVNTLGQVRVTKAFLPFLRQSKGRVINVNSLAGRVVIPLMSSYSMSKYGAVAFTECLRRELDICGVKVISIEPEFFKTALTDSDNLKRQLDTRTSANEKFKSSSGKKFIKLMKLLYTFLDKITSPNIHRVIDAMEAGVSLQHPCPVYNPSGNKIRQVYFYCVANLPDHFLDAFFNVAGLFCSALK